LTLNRHACNVLHISSEHNDKEPAMTAKGKINASNVTTGDRIIVKAWFDAEGHERITESATKTGDGVFVARVIAKTFRAAQGPYEARGKYVIETTAGSFEAAPIQTMWLAPEDAAGIKRAHAEALAEDAHRTELAEREIGERAAEVEAYNLAQAEAARAENEAPGGIYHGTEWASSPSVNHLTGEPVGLTLNRHACNVLPISSEHGEPEEIEMAQNLTHAEARSYPLSNGETADLIALVSSDKPSDWVQATEVQPVGTVVYAYAMGSLRRGVVVKNTPTKTLVALTTAAAAALGGSVRVQTATELHTTVYVAPAPVAEVELDELPDPDGSNTLPIPPEFFQTEGAEDLTLDSQDCKVGPNSENETEEPEMTAQTPNRETTGSAVVRLMEKVHARIRQNHPGVPEVVIVTGAGTGPLGGKWGHFRPQGWDAKDGETTTRIHEMFMAGETLAKGARQVLQTMLHESAHAECEAKGIQDTSRQGRWHNKAFLSKAEEFGLEYRKDKANPQIGYSEVVLTDDTITEYADLLAELDAEIHLMVRLPGWLGGDQDDQGESNGGEGMGKAPKTGPATPNTNNVKCVCRCEEPNIIRMSRKVLDQAVVTCSDCDSLFSAA
jgi:hypothetical protein